MIEGRYTPWDERALMVSTFEIQGLDYKNEKECLHSLSNNDFCNAELIYGRFPAKDLKIKELMLKSGYFVSETSFIVTLNNLQSFELPSIYTRRKVDVSILDTSEYHKVAEISGDMFNHSRFHEDPFIPKNYANDRMSLWVNDLANQNVTCLVNKSTSGAIISFMIFRATESNTVELILGGSRKGHELHSPFFWGSVISYLQDCSYSKVSTTISAANSGVLSLYQNLGFKITDVNVDYHKHVKPLA